MFQTIVNAFKIKEVRNKILITIALLFIYRLYLKGTTFLEIWHNFAALGVFVIIFNLLATITYKKQV